MTQAEVLVAMHNKVRDLTMWYISMLKSVDPHQQYEVNGKKLNSVYWLTAHLAWAENFLLLEATGGIKDTTNWLNHYRLGCDGTLHTDRPDMYEAVKLLKSIHERANQHVFTISDKLIEEENKLGITFGSEKTNRIAIQHCIRHEAMHAGHLSWLCTISGIQTV